MEAEPKLSDQDLIDLAKSRTRELYRMLDDRKDAPNPVRRVIEDCMANANEMTEGDK